MAWAALAAMAGVVFPVGIYLGLKRRAAGPPRRPDRARRGGCGPGGFLLDVGQLLRRVSGRHPDVCGRRLRQRNREVSDRPSLYTAQQNNESMTYTPGAPLLTYALAWVCGARDSIPVYRLLPGHLQLRAQAVVAFLCYVRLIAVVADDAIRPRSWPLGGDRAAPLLLGRDQFHHQSVRAQPAQRFAGPIHRRRRLTGCSSSTRRRGAALPLVLMASIPALGFLVKQSLAIWAPLYCCLPRVLRFAAVGVRSLAFAVSARSASLAGVVAGCYFLWGEPFWYWAFVVMGSYHVPLLRSVQHGLVVWAYYGAGFLAGLGALAWCALRRRCSGRGWSGCCSSESRPTRAGST